MKRFLVFLAIFAVATTAVLAQENEIEADDESKEDDNPDQFTFECTYINSTWPYFGRQFTCQMKSNIKILRQNSTIVAVIGSRNTNAEIQMFSVLLRTCRYIPKGIQNFFPKLVGMKFESTELRYVSKEDFAPFPELRMFNSFLNQIEFIEKDLFINNRKLEFVSFRLNKIKYIDQDVFNGLPLQQLWIDGTQIICGLTGATTKKDVDKVLARLKSSPCVDVSNAPALYLFWLSKQQGSNECEVKLAELTVEKTQLEGELAVAQTAIATAETECNTRIDETTETCNNALECLLAPTPGSDCPTRIAPSIRFR